MRHRLQIFISAVTAEFKSYRDTLRAKLDRPNVDVKVQEDFMAVGKGTLDKLDEYIRSCDVVIHLIGDMVGTFANDSAIAAIKRRCPQILTRIPQLREPLRK